MKDFAPSDLRMRLRRDTRAAHVALDTAISASDPGTAAGLQDFLAMQVLALRALTPAAGDARTAPLIAELLAAAVRDLAALGRDVPADAPSLPQAPHPLAIDYIIAGSRLGTQVLRRQWQAATDPGVAAARAYFGLPDHMDHWRAFCQVAARTEGDTASADRIVADTTMLFQHYLRCLHMARAHRRNFDA